MTNNIDVKKVLSELTLEEKASLCSGYNFWLTKPIDRLGIPQIRMSDGPHGLRKEDNTDTSAGMKKSFPATSFPPAVNLASTWNRDLAYKMGEALAKECLNQHISVLLGPGINIKRSPLCGRNFEYLSEDPFITGELAAKYINGCQSQGIGTSLKHFAVNNQESRRMTINAILDERTMREIYLAGFEKAVKEAQPWTIMCSYNKINGKYSSDNRVLLNDILREEWGFKGMVVSDWNATNNRVAGVRAGMDLEMPSSNGINDKKIIHAVKSGQLNEKFLDLVVSRILELIAKCKNFDISDEYIVEDDKELYAKNHELAREIARESFVLLKNENSALPLNKANKFNVIGKLASEPRYQGSGSSRINPYNLKSFTSYAKEINLDFEFAEGYVLENENRDDTLHHEAVVLANNGLPTLFFLGLTDSFECEGFDRSKLELPMNQIRLLNEVCSVNKNVAVILFGGSPVSTIWAKDVNALLNAYLPGEAGAEALCDIIFGDYSPSGKLAETYANKLDDILASKYFGMGPLNVEHRESIFVGYRYFTSAKKPVAFPFGFGLSYSKFEYKSIIANVKNAQDGDDIEVKVEVENTGNYDAYDVVQLYVRDTKPVIYKADRELKEFTKVFIKKGETKTITFNLNKRSFAYYSIKAEDWIVSSGDYEILVGSSCEDLPLSTTVTLVSKNKFFVEDTDVDSIKDYYAIDRVKQISNYCFRSLINTDIPSNEISPRGQMTENNTIGDLSCCIIGKIFIKAAPRIIKSQVPDADYTTMLMIQQGMLEMPLRGLLGITSGLLDQTFIHGMLMFANKKRIRGLFKMYIGIWKSLGHIISSKKKAKALKKRKDANKKQQEKS